MIKVMIIEDSSTCRKLLKMVLEGTPEIKVVSEFSNAEDAIRSLKRERPDIITMDINLPGINGLEATSLIMETNPIPIILLSEEFSKNTMVNTFDALKCGALTALPKPPAPGNGLFEAYSKNLVFQIKALSDIRLVTRKKRKPVPASHKPSAVKVDQNIIPVVAMGASTGGPPVIQEIFSLLPADFSFPILLVQHISAGFIQGMIEWLQSSTRLKIMLAKTGEQPMPGCVHVAPDDFHMSLDEKGLIKLTKEPITERPRPSVSVLFQSIAENFGEKSIGILLTGMGRDGATELKMMRDNGALTIVQNEETCGVFGMPKMAIDCGGAKMILSPEEIATTIKSIANAYKKNLGKSQDFIYLCNRFARLELT